MTMPFCISFLPALRVRVPPGRGARPRVRPGVQPQEQGQEDRAAQQGGKEEAAKAKT